MANKIDPSHPDPFGKGRRAAQGAIARQSGANGIIVRTMAVELEAAIKLQLSKPGTGRVYIIRGKRHVASAPGKPPAVRTGRLRNSITHGVVDGVMRVGTNVKYAPWLEYGVTDAGRNRDTVIAPRPFMRPAVATMRRNLTEHLTVALRRSGPQGV